MRDPEEKHQSIVHTKHVICVIIQVAFLMPRISKNMNDDTIEDEENDLPIRMGNEEHKRWEEQEKEAEEAEEAEEEEDKQMTTMTVMIVLFRTERVRNQKLRKIVQKRPAKMACEPRHFVDEALFLLFYVVFGF